MNLQTPEIDNLLQQKLNNLRGISNPTPQAQPNEVPFFANVSNCHIPAQTSSFNLSKKTNLNSSGGGGGLETAAGSQAATAIRGEKVREKTGAQIAIDNALYELPDNTDLELGDSVLEKMLKIFFRLTT